MGNISEEAFLTSLPAEEKALKAPYPGINFKPRCLILQSKGTLAMPGKWDKPFERQLRQTSIIPLKTCLKTSGSPEILIVAVKPHDQQHDKKQE